MKKTLISLAILSMGVAYGQKELNVNSNSATTTYGIYEIDSIRFNGNLTEMEVILLDESMSSFLLQNIDNVTFSGSPFVQNTVHCGDPTEVIEVTSLTGRIWMDRNLGASKVADSLTDIAAYGSYYQWGRGSDGHQCPNSGTTSILSSTDQPGHDDFITIQLSGGSPYNWRSPKNDDLWQDVDGINNPCPCGFRLPTTTEFQAEVATWNTMSADGGFESVLKLTLAGRAPYEIGNAEDTPFTSGIHTHGYFWTSNVNENGGGNIRLNNFSQPYVYGFSGRATGMTVRCIKD